MPRRSILSATERASLLSMPHAQDDLIRRYTFSDADLTIIGQHCGAANRLGFAVQLCYMRFPGVMLESGDVPPDALLALIVSQLKVPQSAWGEYGARENTRREHLIELQTVYGFKPFTMRDYRPAAHSMTEIAMQTDKGIVLAKAMIEGLRHKLVLMPAMNVIERICAEAITRANKRIYATLSDSLTHAHRQRLDELLLHKEGSKTTKLAWLRLSPKKPNSRHMLEQIASRFAFCASAASFCPRFLFPRDLAFRCRRTRDRTGKG